MSVITPVIAVRFARDQMSRCPANWRETKNLIRWLREGAEPVSLMVESQRNGLSWNTVVLSDVRSKARVRFLFLRKGRDET